MPLVAFWLLASASPSVGAPPAAGGVRLFDALERAPVSVVAVVRGPTQLDAFAYRADLDVETSLVGSVQPGDLLAVAWEERSPPREVRFRDGQRVLVSLERLPGDSIWGMRFSDPAERRRHWFVAETGGAFAREPSGGSVGILDHYLALPPELRARNRGVGYLIRLARAAEPVLALAAVERLDAVRGLDAAIDPSSASRLVEALLRADAGSELPDAVLDLVGDHDLVSLREPLEARAGDGARGPAPVYEALGRLDGSLSPELSRALLARADSAPHRAVGARYAGGPVAPGELARRLRRDGAPEVRAAAVTRLVELVGVEAVDRAVYALGDGDVRVRTAAIAALGGLGPDAVPPLRVVVETGSIESARSAVAALRLAGGDAGYRALIEIAETHPDESVRLLARAALGRSISPAH